MHVLQFILVEADDTASALRAANAVADNATWSDWYDVGGRWQGYFADSFPDLAEQLEDPSVLPVWDYPVETQQILDDIAKRQDRTFLQCRDALAGNSVAASDIDGHIFGMPVADSEAAAVRISQENQRSADSWQRILRANSLAEAGSAGSTGFMSLYYARRMLNVLEGTWDSDSGYYDAIAYSCDTIHLREALTGGRSAEYQAESPLFLVAVDFHY